jgi:hypothetical protein
MTHMERIGANHQTIRLAKGAHKPTDGEGCFVEVAGLLHTGQWTGDSPNCFCPALTAFCRVLNDWLRDDERHVLWPFTLRMGETAGDGRLLERGFRFADLAVRELAPVALDAAGRSDDAERLRVLPVVVDPESASAAAVAAAASAAAASAAAAHAVAASAAAALAVAVAAAARAAAHAHAAAAIVAAYDAARAAAHAAASVAAAHAVAASAAAGAVAYDAAHADRQRVIDLCLAVLDELCPPAPCAQDAELLNWAALRSLARA